MILNGKEYNLEYTIGVRVAYNNWAAANPKKGITEAIIQEFLLMIAGWNKAHNGNQAVPSIDELAALPGWAFDDIKASVEECERLGSERKVEAEPSKK